MTEDLYKDYFENRKVTVMGLGLLGRGLGDTYFLAKHGAELIVTDKKTEEELKTSLDALQDFPGITYHLGGHRMEDFEKRDFILKAAGVPLTSEYIAHAKESDVSVHMSAALVTSIIGKYLEGVTIIGVTGTRGKSTATQMIAHILTHSGMRVVLGGNIRNISNLPILEVIEEGDYLVMELDSWQLQGFGDLKVSPSIAVFTSFMDDHMNYYSGDKEAYFADKANIYRNQTEYDVLIASAQARDEIAKRDKVKVVVPEEEIFAQELIGSHNQVLASLSAEAARQCGVEDEQIREALATFKAVEGRLQYMGEFGERKIRVFNDNNATTGDAVIAAIHAVHETYNKKPILIIGGADKGLPLASLEQELLIGTKQCIFLAGSGTDRLTLPKEFVFDRLEDCVACAFDQAFDGDVIVFSPGFASFSKYFNNEYERNDTFVQSLKSYQ